MNIAFGAVSWGYATIEALREHFPDEEFGSVSAIRRIAWQTNAPDLREKRSLVNSTIRRLGGR